MRKFAFSKVSLTAVLFFSLSVCFAQDARQLQDSLRRLYNADMKTVSAVFSGAYYQNRPAIYSLDEIRFLNKLDSLKQPFLDVTRKYEESFQIPDSNFIANEQRDIGYFFDRMILDYPYFHENHTGKKIQLSKPTQAGLNKHLKDFDAPALLSSVDFRSYVEAFLRHQSTTEVKKKRYKASDNKRLDAYLTLVPKCFTNQETREYWQYHYLAAHLEDWGSKNIAQAVDQFRKICSNVFYIRTIDSMYRESRATYQGHLVETYKTVDGYKLDLHIFLPDSPVLHFKKTCDRLL